MHFLKMGNAKGHLLIIKTQILNPLSVLNCCLYCDRSFINKYCVQSMIHKSAFLNFVSQFIRKIFHSGTTKFYRLACVIVGQGAVSPRGPGTFWGIIHNRSNFLFPLYFIKIWWKSYIFLKIPLIFFLWSLFLGNCPEV